MPTASTRGAWVGLAGVDPFAYIRDVLMRIHTHPAERIAELILREWKTRFCPATNPPA